LTLGLRFEDVVIPLACMQKVGTPQHVCYRNRTGIRRQPRNKFFDIRGRTGRFGGQVARGAAAELSEGSRGRKIGRGSGDPTIQSLDPRNGMALRLVTRSLRRGIERNAAQLVEGLNPLVAPDVFVETLLHPTNRRTGKRLPLMIEKTGIAQHTNR
jgi:hypothetical protein